MTTIAQLEAQQHAARVADLEGKLKQASRDARQARDEAQTLINQFHADERQVSIAHAAYRSELDAIVRVEDAMEKQEFPSENEIAAFQAQRASLTVSMEDKRKSYVATKEKLEGLRMEAVKADRHYIQLASVARSIENQLALEKDEAGGNLKGGTFGVR